jgi:hypothetical protein
MLLSRFKAIDNLWTTIFLCLNAAACLLLFLLSVSLLSLSLISLSLSYLSISPPDYLPLIFLSFSHSNPLFLLCLSLYPSFSLFTPLSLSLAHTHTHTLSLFLSLISFSPFLSFVPILTLPYLYTFSFPIVLFLLISDTPLLRLSPLF